MDATLLQREAQLQSGGRLALMQPADPIPLQRIELTDTAKLVLYQTRIQDHKDGECRRDSSQARLQKHHEMIPEGTAS
jgi:hypothetical protein